MVKAADTDTLKHTVELVQAWGQYAAAERLGVSRSAVQHRMRQAAKKGLVPREQYAMPWPQPEGRVLGKVTTFVKPDGDLGGQWVQSVPEGETLEDALDLIEERLSALSVKPAPVLPAPSAPLNADLLTVYVLGDHHFGMFSWARETGEDYDTAIAWQVLERAMMDLVANSPPASQGLVLNLGDFFHADDDAARTRRSGNQLDVDTRFARVLAMGIDLTILTIQLALQKHEHVTYRALAGNHDPYASLALALAVAKFFAHEPRVTVDTDPSYFFVLQWGDCMVCATHGDMTKPNDVVGVMAAKWPTIWGATRFRYAYLGHVHHTAKSRDVFHGAVWETFETLAAKDSWTAQMGYTSGRSMTAITLHKTEGERFRTVRALTAKETI